MNRGQELAAVVASNALQLERSLVVIDVIGTRFGVSPAEVIAEYRRQGLLRLAEVKRRNFDRVSIASRHHPRQRRASW